MFSRIVQLVLPLLDSRQPRESPPARPPAPAPLPVHIRPALHDIWHRLWQEFFPDRSDLAHYHLVWSNRNQRSCLASCNPTARRVNVAKLLQHPSAAPILEPLLYHEMCHAVLGPPQRVNGRFVIHGAQFKALERRHPLIPALNRWIKEGHWHALVQTNSPPPKRRRPKRQRRGKQQKNSRTRWR